MRIVLAAVLAGAWLVGVSADGVRAEEAPALTFDQALDAIVARSTDIATQRAQVSETVAGDIPARTAFLPKVTLAGVRESAPSVTGTSAVSQGVNADAKLNLFRFGADVKGWSAASASEDSQGLHLAAVVLLSEQSGVAALIAEIQSLQEIDVLDRIVATEEELLKIGHERYDKGLLPSQEVDKILVDTENARAQLADAQVRENTARANLVALLGPARVRVEEWPWLARLKRLQTDAEDRKTLMGSESDWERRPDVRSALSNLSAQEALASSKARQVLPTLDADLNFGWLAAPVDSGYVANRAATLTLTIPLFDGLVNYSNARIQYFEREKADVALELARRNAQSDWSQSRDNFAVALKTAWAREKTSQVSSRLYRDSLARFRLGKISVDDLALEEQRLSNSELLATAGWAQAHTALAQLCHARGLKLGECF